MAMADTWPSPGITLSPHASSYVWRGKKALKTLYAAFRDIGMADAIAIERAIRSGAGLKLYAFGQRHLCCECITLIDLNREFEPALFGVGFWVVGHNGRRFYRRGAHATHQKAFRGDHGIEVLVPRLPPALGDAIAPLLRSPDVYVYALVDTDTNDLTGIRLIDDRDPGDHHEHLARVGMSHKIRDYRSLPLSIWTWKVPIA